MEYAVLYFVGLPVVLNLKLMKEVGDVGTSVASTMSVIHASAEFVVSSVRKVRHPPVEAADAQV